MPSDIGHDIAEPRCRRKFETSGAREGDAKDVLGTGRYGDIPAANVSAVQDYLVATGQLEKKLDPAEYYDNTLIDRINDFDADAIVARAKSFKLD
jgi:hypothetical protein